jgi:hypothetical protein
MGSEAAIPATDKLDNLHENFSLSKKMYTRGCAAIFFQASYPSSFTPSDGYFSTRAPLTSRRTAMKWVGWALLLVTLASAGPASAQFYKYWDKQGVLRFTDDINQVPDHQRDKLQTYAASPSAAAAATDPGTNGEKKSTTLGAAAQGPGSSALHLAAEEEGIVSARVRLEELKQQADADYQALANEKEALGKEKNAPKTHQQVVDYNQRVEAFNQRASAYETRRNELRNQIENYNARVLEENANTAPPGKN